MTNTEIYRRAIIKIGRNHESELYIPRLLVDRKELYDYEIYYNIFSHDFARGLWGSGDVDDQGRTIDEGWKEQYEDSGLFMDIDDYEYGSDWNIAYQYHLKQMVMCDNPLKYLEKFL